VNDKAERLHVLISRAQVTAQEVHIKVGSSNVSLHNMALWQAFDPLAGSMGYSDYSELRDSFRRLCDSIRYDVQTIPLHKETVRASWLSCIQVISEVFDAHNFAAVTHSVFNTHWSSRNLELLDAISERFQATGLRESTPLEMEEALSAVRDVIAEFKKSGKLHPRIAATLSHYLQQMEAVFAHVEDFGDETFWRVYKETFATFVQLHPVISGLENSDDIKGKIKVAAEKLTTKMIAGVSLGADLASIGAAVLPLLS
jgi:hypothetical protein